MPLISNETNNQSDKSNFIIDMSQRKASINLNNSGNMSSSMTERLSINFNEIEREKEQLIRSGSTNLRQDLLQNQNNNNNLPSSYLAKILSAIFYASTSCAITIINKEVLTNYNFPAANIVILGQIISTVVVLFIAKHVFRLVSFPSLFSRPGRIAVKKIFPLPILYMANLFGGILSTKSLSLTMFVCLRRFSILMTMIGESIFLGYKHANIIQISVFIMLFGSFIAAINDLAFNLYGYFCITVNNLATAANGVCTKRKLDTTKELGKYGILFYNALFTLPLAYFITVQTNSFEKAFYSPNFQYWSDSKFQVLFFLSCLMGLILNLSSVLCTQYNTPLVTTVVGTLKNIFVAYYGIIFPTEDYLFNWSNVTGVTVSVVGSMLFSYYSFMGKSGRK